ncbi:MAG: hypothetical protein Ta2A_15290 [Treponemataceae bacterium]|nr:MAG: hypothetical protein Ta2A_15290 [Treponemataceae bacterium]
MKTKMITKVASFSAAVLLFFLSACSDLTTVRLPSAKTKSTVGKLVELQVHWKIGGVPDGVMPFSVGGKQQLFSFTLADDVDDVTLLMRTSPDIRIEYLVTDVFEHITSESLSTKDAVIAPGYQSIDIDMSYRVETNIYLHVGNLIYTVKLLKAVPTKCYYVRETGDGGSTIDDVRGGTNRGKRPETAFFSLKHAAYMATLTDIREIYVIGELKSDPQVDPQADSLFVVDGTSEHAIRVRGMRDTVTGRDGALDASGTGKRVMNVNKSTVTFVGLKFVGGGDGETTITEGGGIKITGDMQNSRFVQSNVRFYNCVITGNKTYGMGKGGGVYAESSIVKFEFTTVSDNYSNSEGGGIYATAKDESSPASVITVSGGEVSANKAYAKGGGLYIGGATAAVGSTLTVMNNAEVKNNILDGGKGGGIYVGGDTVQRSASTDGYTLTFDNAKVWGNTVGYGSGSGVYFSGTEFYFRGNSVVGHENPTTSQQVDERQFGNIIEMQDDRQLTVDTTVPVPSAANGLAAIVETGASVGTQVLIGSGINDSTRRFARFRPRRAEIGLYCDKIFGYSSAGTLYSSDTIHVAASGGNDFNDGLSEATAFATFERACTAANIFTAPKIQIIGYLTAANHSDSYDWTSDPESTFTVAIPISHYHAPLSIGGKDSNSGFATESGKRVLAVKGTSRVRLVGPIRFNGSAWSQVNRGNAVYVAPAAILFVDGAVNAGGFSIMSEGNVTVNAGATLNAQLLVRAGVSDVYGTLGRGGEVDGSDAAATINFHGGAIVQYYLFYAKSTHPTRKGVITAAGNFSSRYGGRIVMDKGSQWILDRECSAQVDVLPGGNFTMKGEFAKVSGVGRVWLGKKSGVTGWSDTEANDRITYASTDAYIAENWGIINLEDDVSPYAAVVYIGTVATDVTNANQPEEKYDYKRPIVNFGVIRSDTDGGLPKFTMGNAYWHVRKAGFSDGYGHLRVDADGTGAPADEITDFSTIRTVMADTPGTTSAKGAASGTRFFRRLDASGNYLGWDEVYEFTSNPGQDWHTHHEGTGAAIHPSQDWTHQVLFPEYAANASGLYSGPWSGSYPNINFYEADGRFYAHYNGSGPERTLEIPDPCGEYISMDITDESKVRVLLVGGGGGGGGGDYDTAWDKYPGEHGGNGGGGIVNVSGRRTLKFRVGHGGHGSDYVITSTTVRASDATGTDLYVNGDLAAKAHGGKGGNGADNNAAAGHGDYPGVASYNSFSINSAYSEDGIMGQVVEGNNWWDWKGGFYSNIAANGSITPYGNRGTGGYTSFRSEGDGKYGSDGRVILNVRYPVGN